MILTIIASLILIAIIVLIIIMIKNDAHKLLLIPIFLSFFVIMPMAFVIYTAVYFDVKEYDMLMREIKYAEVYSSDVEKKIYSWNEELTTTNNYWCRFQTKDREQYYIDVNIYLDKFKS